MSIPATCLTLRELAKRWRCRRSLILQLIDRRQLKAWKLGDGLGRRNVLRINLDEVQRYEEQHAAAPPPAPPRRRTRPGVIDYYP